MNYVVFRICEAAYQSIGLHFARFPDDGYHNFVLFPTNATISVFFHKIIANKYKTMYGPEWWTVYALTRVLLWCWFPELPTREMNTKNIRMSA